MIKTIQSLHIKPALLKFKRKYTIIYIRNHFALGFFILFDLLAVLLFIVDVESKPLANSDAISLFIFFSKDLGPCLNLKLNSRKVSLNKIINNQHIYMTKFVNFRCQENNACDS